MVDDNSVWDNYEHEEPEQDPFEEDFGEVQDHTATPSPHAGETQINATTGRRRINIGDDRNLNEILMDMLLAIGGTVYHADGKLVDIQKLDGEWVIRDLSETEMVNYLCRQAEFYRVHTDKKGNQTEKVTNSPTLQQRKDVMKSTKIIERHVRALNGITHAPALLPDGTVLTTAGYHAASGLYVVNDCKEKIPKKPNLEDARIAAMEVLNVFSDYPWAEEVDKWMYLTALMTGAGRRALGNAPVPGIYINAFDRGAGKSALTESIVNINFKGAAARSGWPGQSEMEKRVSAWGLEKPEAIVFDNIKTKMGGQAIEDTLTSAKFGGRKLGSTQGVRGRFLSVILVNANDGTMTEDLARRFWHIRITKQTKRGDEYHMTEMTPRDYALKHNERLKAKLITILKAYMLLKVKPDSSRRIASFEEWSDLVLAASEWVATEEGGRQFETQKSRERTARTEEVEVMSESVILFHEFSDGDWKSMKDIRMAAETQADSFSSTDVRAMARSILNSLPDGQRDAGRHMSALMKSHETKAYEVDGVTYFIEKRRKAGHVQWRWVRA